MGLPNEPLSRLTHFGSRACIATVGIVFDWRSRRGGAGELPDHSINKVESDYPSSAYLHIAPRLLISRAIRPRYNSSRPIT